MVGCTIYYQSHHPPSLTEYYQRYYPVAQMLDIIRCLAITILYEKPIPHFLRFVQNRFQPILMTIRNGIHVTRAGRVLEYALYYYADIQHVYELEHCWMYLNAREELIGVKATRHGVFMTLFSTPQSIQYFKGDPILFVAPGKHEMTSDLTMFNFQILDKACSSRAGSVGLYRFYFVDRDNLRRIAQVSKDKKKPYIHQKFLEKYAFHPSFRWRKCQIINDRVLRPWDTLQKAVPDYLITFLKQL